MDEKWGIFINIVNKSSTNGTYHVFDVARNDFVVRLLKFGLVHRVNDDRQK